MHYILQDIDYIMFFLGRTEHVRGKAHAVPDISWPSVGGDASASCVPHCYEGSRVTSCWLKQVSYPISTRQQPCKILQIHVSRDNTTLDRGPLGGYWYNPHPRQNHGLSVWTPNVESLYTHSVPSQNQGPYSKLHPNMEESSEGPN